MFGELGTVMQVTELIPGKRVGWRCVEGPAEWVGTDLTFDLSTWPSAAGADLRMDSTGADPGMEEVFRAVADPSRRRLLDSLNRHNGQTLRELCSGLDMARQSVSKHLAILEEARLVTTVRRGREKLHYLNAAPISDIADRWISHYDRPPVEALADLKKSLEGITMTSRNSSTPPTSAPRPSDYGAG